MKFRVLAALAVLLLSAPSALGVQCALAPTRGDVAGWLAAAGIELAYLSLAFATFADQRRQRLAARVARAAVLTAITLNVIADYAARVPAGLSGAAQFLATFDWLLLALSLLESAPLAALAYTLATLLHTHSSAQHTADAEQSHPQPDTYPHSDANPHPHPNPDAQSHPHPQPDVYPHPDTNSHPHPQPDASHTASHTTQHTAHTDTHTAHMASHMTQYTSHTDTHPQSHTAHTQRTTYRCPHCGAALAKQQQYAAARRYGYCGKCKGK